MLITRCIGYGRGSNTYKVEGDIALYTDEEVADKCDAFNFGYKVIYKNSYEMKIVVYVD
jgi:hypothetical protein